MELILVTFIIFFFSLCGIILNFRNFLITLMGLELLLLSLNLNFIFFSIYLDDLYGQIFSLFILTIAAAESALGLAILISFYRIYNNLFINKTSILKG